MDVSDLSALLQAARKAGAADLLVIPGSPPALRVAGQVRLLDGPALDGSATRDLIQGALTEDQLRRLDQTRELDFSLVRDGHRYRGNASWQAGMVAGAFRLIPDVIPSVEELGVPPAVVEFIERPQGLVLVTGASDQGKTTTQASLVDLLNRHHAKHIITIEDPVEFVHRHQRSLISQRELGSDTLSFAEALRHALRQSPDVILVGEMRDPETIRAALTAAETGHLVVSTLHTNDACQALDRVISTFPEHEQAQVRAQLSLSLLGVVAQRLVRTIQGRLALATEILQNTRAVSHLIREGRIEMLYNAMEVGRESGMQTMNQALRGLVDRGDVDPAEAARYVSLFESGGWGVVASPRPAMPRSEPRPAPEAAARAGRA
jgi:twitching motility protein PilT